MKKVLLTLVILTLTLSRTFAQFPDITSWIINNTITGYGGILADCQLVQSGRAVAQVSLGGQKL